jgi:protocatechuate 3,4-dioxygenase beta subunit
MLAATSPKETTMADSQGDNHLYHPTRRRLLRDLTGAGVGVAGVGLIGREVLGHDGSREVADAAAPSCTLSPELTEGPYYLDLDKIRRDVREGKAGLRLDLRIKVVNASSCKPLQDVAVEIWHADAGGTYSGFSQEGTAGKTYLRGVQLTGESGVAQFRTIYPGWYVGRAIHIHLKAHVGGRAAGRTYKGGQTAHTGQLFFNESVNDRVVRLSPYSGRSGARTRNSEDSIYGQAGSGALLRLRRRKASTIRKGLIGAITVGIDPS